MHRSFRNALAVAAAAGLCLAGGAAFAAPALACRLTCAFAPCGEAEFSFDGFPHVVAGCGAAVL